MNHNRMTVRPTGQAFQVFKLKRERQGGYATDMAAQRFAWLVSAKALPRFTGTYAECIEFIESQGAVFMTEHGIPC